MKRNNSSLWTVYYVILIVLLIVILGSCNPVKQVLKSPAKLERVGRVWERANGCTTKTIVLEGIDSLRIDTVYNNDIQFGGTDTLIDLRTGATIIRYRIKEIIKHHYRVDTFRTEDLRRLQLSYDDNNKLKGANEVLTKSLKEERQRGNKWLYFFIGLCGLNALVIYFRLSKFNLK